VDELPETQQMQVVEVGLRDNRDEQVYVDSDAVDESDVQQVGVRELDEVDEQLQIDALEKYDIEVMDEIDASLILIDVYADIDEVDDEEVYMLVVVQIDDEIDEVTDKNDVREHIIDDDEDEVECELEDVDFLVEREEVERLWFVIELIEVVE
jgi:hypothetical protein